MTSCGTPAASATTARSPWSTASAPTTPSPPGLLHFANGPVEVLVNLTNEPVPLPTGARMPAASTAVSDQLPAEAAIWFVRE
jgi:hypothetical protein